jgi:hypothetical protein
MRTDNGFVAKYGLQLISADTGSVMASTTYSHSNIDIFINIDFKMADGRIKGTLGDSGYNRSPSEMKNVILRLWVGSGQSSGSEKTLDVAVWAQDSHGMLAPIATDGLSHTEDMRVNINGTTIEVEDLDGGEFMDTRLNFTLMATDFHVDRAGGSRVLIVEIMGTSPFEMLAYTNARQVQLVDGMLVFGSKLYASSATLTDTVLFQFGDQDGKIVRITEDGQEYEP